MRGLKVSYASISEAETEHALDLVQYVTRLFHQLRNVIYDVLYLRISNDSLCSQWKNAWWLVDNNMQMRIRAAIDKMRPGIWLDSILCWHGARNGHLFCVLKMLS